MTVLSDWRKSVRTAAKARILRILGHDSMSMHLIYSRFKTLESDLCDDSIDCEHAGVIYGGHEWKHQVRWALQDLKSRGRVRNVPRSGWTVI